MTVIFTNSKLKTSICEDTDRACVERMDREERAYWRRFNLMFFGLPVLMGVLMIGMGVWL